MNVKKQIIFLDSSVRFWEGQAQRGVGWKAQTGWARLMQLSPKYVGGCGYCVRREGPRSSNEGESNDIDLSGRMVWDSLGLEEIGSQTELASSSTMLHPVRVIVDASSTASDTSGTC